MATKEISLEKQTFAEKSFYKKKSDDPARPVRKYKVQDINSIERKVLKDLEILFSGKKKSNYVAGGHGFNRSSYLQNCVIKMLYKNDLKSHLSFFNEYLEQLKKGDVTEKPMPFNKDGVMDKNKMMSYESRATSKFYKFIISPESQEVDLQKLVTDLMSKIDVYHNRKFDWVAAIHNDTNHRHAHVLINGVDLDGKSVDKFSRVFITKDMRELARVSVTDQIGFRTKDEIIAEMKRKTDWNRFTDYDKILLGMQNYFTETDGDFAYWVKTKNTVLLKRLMFLEKLGLAQKFNNSTVEYKLEKNWDKTLRALGRYNMFLNARTNLKYVPGANLELYSGEGGKIEGEVTNVFIKDDESIWTNAFVVEDKRNNKAYYIPTNYQPFENSIGKYVVVESEKNAKGRMAAKIRFLKDR